jgi:two-component system, OmpR family, sensor histidine kinase YxdK
VKLFLKDHLDFIIFYLFQLFLLLLLSGLDLVIQDSILTKSTLVYMFILSTSCLFIFLLYRYFKFNKNYIVIAEEWSTIHSGLHPFAESSAFYRVLNNRFTDLFQLYTAEITKTNQAKERYYTFIHQWVHQMKTPLSVIHLMLQDDEKQLSKQSLEEEIDRLQAGLELVLHSARLESFEKDLKVEQVSLTELTRTVIHTYKKSFIKNGVFPEMKMENFVVESDRKWLAFVIGQIVTNAIKYSAKKGQKILFSTKIDYNSVQLIIEDQGWGIPEQDVGRVFEPFFTGANGRKFQESTGMGLYLCKLICENLGHGLTIESSEGQGASVKLTFFTS